MCEMRQYTFRCGCSFISSPFWCDNARQTRRPCSNIQTVPGFHLSETCSVCLRAQAAARQREKDNEESEEEVQNEDQNGHQDDDDDDENKDDDDESKDDDDDENKSDDDN